MGIRPILVLTTACAALFGISFAVGGVFNDDGEPAEAPSAKSALPVTTDEPTLALGRAAGLPDLRTPPKPPEPTHEAAPVIQPQAATAVAAPAPEPTVAPAPSYEPTPPPAPPAPVQEQTPVTPSPPQSSTPDNSSSSPSPDGAPSQPSPSPDPYASGGSRFYDDDDDG
jgi:hypothetical protein